MNQQSKDDLIHAIGQKIISDPPTDGGEWFKLALVVEFDDGSQSIHGFYYDESNEAEPADVKGFDLVEQVAELRQAMAESKKTLWHCCLIQLVRASKRIVFTFEYDNPDRWHITAKTLEAMRTAICPPDDL